MAEERFYTTFKISENISETPEGFLLCKDVPILRAGDLIYDPDEVSITPGDGPTVLSRTTEEIHRPETIASFEGKPVCYYHPTDDSDEGQFVTPENWKEFAVGTVQNVRPGEGDDGDKILCDLLITDEKAIGAVRTKRLREVSAAYKLKTIEIEPGKGEQKDIIGNHVALVPKGRCGSECAIFDHEKIDQKKDFTMALKQKLLEMVGKSFDEASEKEKAQDEAVEPKEKAADEEMPSKKEEVKDEAMPDEQAEDQEPPKEEEVADADPVTMIMDRLSSIEAVLIKLVGANSVEESEAPEILESAPAGTVEDNVADEEPKEEKIADSVSYDEETISRAEILAPGIAQCEGLVEKCLDVAYKSDDGKNVIDTLLGGRSFDSADKALLFVSASELLKQKRRENLGKTGKSFDAESKPMSSGVITAEALNEINAKIYGKK